MGCGGSKKTKKNDLTMEETGSSELDEIFNGVSAPLQSLQAVNKSLGKSIKRLQRLTYSRLIRDSTVDQSITLMMANFSAPQQGDITKIELTIQASSPFLVIDKSALPPECHKMAKAWDKLIAALGEAPGELAPLPGQIAGLAQTATELPDKLDAAKSSVSPLQVPKLLKAFNNNLMKLRKAPEILEETQKTLQETNTLLAGLVTKLSDDHEKEKIKKIAEAANSKGTKDPKEVVIEHWIEPTQVDPKLDKPKKPKKKATNQ